MITDLAVSQFPSCMLLVFFLGVVLILSAAHRHSYDTSVLRVAAGVSEADT